jgi:hypothetical protein
VALAAAALLFAGCSDPDPVAAGSGDLLDAGTTYSADLDGDGESEEILIDGAPASLTITDGDVVYQSRDRWQVVEAGLGDTDHDGLLEVVTLLDSDEGRHLGLFAYFGGEYRERLVTSELSPRPVAFEIVPSDQATQGAISAAGDMVSLTLEPAPGQTESQTVLCRWNGFGFTSIESPAAP